MTQLTPHPLQSRQWGKFRKKTGLEVISIAPGFQMTIHPIPKLSYTIGYIPKCPIPSNELTMKLKQIGRENKCIFIKLEPNVLIGNSKLSILNSQFVKSSHPNFYTHSFHIDLTKSENELLMQAKSKTRYNIRVSQKHNVTIKEDNSDEAFEEYIQLSKKTWKRKGFKAHGEGYHRNMWEVMHRSGIAHLLVARYNNQTLTAWILFLYKNILYYPYGASSDEYKNTMASNLMMWEAIRWGKKKGATLFDLWGCLGLKPNKNHPWYGFHKFKEGYGGELVEYVGSYDLVINKTLYQIYNILYPIRQKILNL